MDEPFKHVLGVIVVALIFVLGYFCGRRDERRQINIRREYEVVFRETAHGNYYIDLIPKKENEK